jgi:hypothetical protein
MRKMFRSYQHFPEIDVNPSSRKSHGTFGPRSYLGRNPKVGEGESVRLATNLNIKMNGESVLLQSVTIADSKYFSSETPGTILTFEVYPSY